MKQTAVSLLKETLYSEMKSGTKMVVNWDMYLEMEKQQMFGFTNHHHVIGEGTERFFKEEFELWYNETYGSKGSDDHIVDTNEMVSSQTEISDEEIEKEADNTYVKYNAYAIEGFIDGAKWYREQLKISNQLK
jgi:hypothetical protein